MDYVHLQTEAIQLEPLYRRVVASSCGAISSFIGITRDHFQGRRVTRLSYEAYEPMALKELQRLCNDARKKFAHIEHIAICHRLGDVSISDISVAIYVSGPHRRDVLDAVSFLIEQLKTNVPIWKKEFYEDAQDNDDDGDDDNKKTSVTSYAWKENQ